MSDSDLIDELLADEHRRVLREVWLRHGGVEVDTAGDAFFVAFGRASDAVGAASEAQLALADGRVRVAVGHPILRCVAGFPGKPPGHGRWR